MATNRYSLTTLRALDFVKTGAGPLDAWQRAWAEISGPEKPSKSCPKWAFCLLCHHGHIKGVVAGCCPESLGRKDWVIQLFAELRLDGIDWADGAKKTRVSNTVFQGRQPEQEIEVLLALRSIGAI